MRPTRIQQFTFDQIPGLSAFDRAYQRQEDNLLPFLRNWPGIEEILQYAKDRPYSSEQRAILSTALKEQFERIGMLNDVDSKLKQLQQKNTFTIVTAHQPVLFGGPLYIIYKAVSAIKLAKRLNEMSKDVNIVPVFVVGGEDHDFEEMNHLTLFGKRVEWKDDQGGSVGRFSLKGISDVLNEVEDILGDQGDSIMGILKASFNENEGLTYGQAYQKFLQTLFKNTPLLVIQMDDLHMKRSFIPYMTKEIVERPSQSIIQETQQKLAGEGYSEQAYVRPINLFYLKEHDRVQIEFENGQYLLGEDSMQENELIELLEEHPDRFSPNVVMRPLYQEVVLPNLAYIGGGGELAYWKERKAHFEHFNVPFPFLVRRDSVLWLDDYVLKRMSKCQIETEDLLRDMHEVTKEVISRDLDIDDQIDEEKDIILREFEKIQHQIEQFDTGLSKYVAAEARKLEKTLENIESKIIRSAKKRESDTVSQIEKSYDHAFPNQNLQERVENFMSYYAKYGEEWIEYLTQSLDPLNRNFKVIEEIREN